MTGFDLAHRLRGGRGLVLAAFVALAAGLPSLMLLPPLDRDESRYAQATSQMLETGDYVDIRFQDEPRWKKPIGIYWMQAAAVAVPGSVEARNIVPYRLPSLLGAMIAAIACAWVGAAVFGTRTGILAGAIMGACFLLSTEAGIAKTDAVLVACVTAAMAALMRIYLAVRANDPPNRGHKLIFWGALGLSILVKGPISLIVIVPAILALSLWDRDIRWLRPLGWGWGLALVALIVGPWALAITVATDGGFWREAIGGDLAPKIAGGHESHGAPPGLYLLLLPLLFFPATLLLPASISTAWHRRTDPAIRFLICWLVPAWLIFELTPTKLAHYTLPTFGALALLAAVAMARPIGALSGTIRQLRPLAIAPQLTRVLKDANLHPRQGLTTSPVAITTFHEPSFVFLTGRATQLTDAEGAARALAEGRPAIVEARDAEAFAQAAARLGVTGRAVGEVSGHNYSTGDDVNLTVYAPPGSEVSPGSAR